MKQKSYAEGKDYYRKKGLSKAITINLSKEVHAKLTEKAHREERSLQIFARRVLEKEANA